MSLHQSTSTYRTCTVPGCDRKIHAKLMCHKHYARSRYQGQKVNGPSTTRPLITSSSRNSSKMMTQGEFDAWYIWFSALPEQKRIAYCQLNKLPVQWAKYEDEKIKTAEEKFKQVDKTMAFYERDIILFRNHYLNRSPVPWQERRLRKIYQLINKGYKRFGFLDPKRHGKTTIVQDFIIHYINFNRMHAVKYLTKTKELATEKIQPIIAEFESNYRLQQDYGKYRLPDNTWRRSAIVLSRPFKIDDPTLEAVGVDSSYTGKNCDLLIVDDPVDATMSDYEMEQAHNTLFNEAFNIMKPEGIIFFLMTRKGWEDLAECFINPECWVCHQNHKQMYHTFINQAIQKGDYEHEGPDTFEYIRDEYGTIIDVAIYGDYQVMSEGPAPVDWTIERCLMKRAEIGFGFFEQQYQNNPAALKGLKFKYDDIQWWSNDKFLTNHFDIHNLPKYIAADLALSPERTADYSGIVVFTITPRNHCIILDTSHKRQHLNAPISDPESKNTTFETLKELSDRWQVKQWYIEAVAHFGVLTMDWPSMYRASMVFEKNVEGQKAARVATLEGRFQNGQIWLHPSMTKLIEEITKFPATKHYHMLDALELGISKVGGSTVRVI